MTGAVKAAEVAPKVFGRAGGGSVLMEKSDDLTYDLHHLLASDSHPVSNDCRCAGLSIDATYWLTQYTNDQERLHGYSPSIPLYAHLIMAMNIMSLQVDLERFKKDPEGYLLETATFAVQGIVER